MTSHLTILVTLFPGLFPPGNGAARGVKTRNKSKEFEERLKGLLDFMYRTTFKTPKRTSTDLEKL